MALRRRTVRVANDALRRTVRSRQGVPQNRPEHERRAPLSGSLSERRFLAMIDRVHCYVNARERRDAPDLHGVRGEESPSAGRSKVSWAGVNIYFTMRVNANARVCAWPSPAAERLTGHSKSCKATFGGG